jgi:hypothetical protein
MGYSGPPFAGVSRARSPLDALHQGAEHRPLVEHARAAGDVAGREAAENATTVRSARLS